MCNRSDNERRPALKFTDACAAVHQAVTKDPCSPPSSLSTDPRRASHGVALDGEHHHLWSNVSRLLKEGELYYHTQQKLTAGYSRAHILSAQALSSSHSSVSVNTAVFSECTRSRTVTPNISVTIEYDLLAPSLHDTDVPIGPHPKGTPR